MDLIARDRSAIYFSEVHKGAQVMICSEIGSEGRNFQFASNLVLFDLPVVPDLLEQRIGRLDRIGQENDVTIHVPYLEGTAQDRLFHWYHEGMDLFAEPNPVAQSIADEMSDRLLGADMPALINETKELNRTRRDAVNRGRDHLLELNSHRPDVSAAIVTDITAMEASDSLADYMEASFDLFGLESETIGDGVVTVKPTESMLRNVSVSLETAGHFHYPELPEDGIQITYDRDIALAREDVGFFTWENPIVQQALDVVVADVTGNSTMIAIRHASLPSGTLLLETLYVVDCVAPAELNVDRFLPPSVLRCLVTPTLEEVGGRIPFQSFADEALEVPDSALHAILDSQIDGIKAMLDAARNFADEHLSKVRTTATEKTESAMDAELSRLDDLMKVNPTIRPEEIEYLRLTKELVQEAIGNAGMRLDAVRVIVVA